MRPSLVLHGTEGRARRILAELSDKPWAVLDGEPWQVTFPVDGAIASSATLELSVAPDIVVTLRCDAGAQSARTLDVTRPVAEPPNRGPEPDPMSGTDPDPDPMSVTVPDPEPDPDPEPTPVPDPTPVPARTATRPTAGRAPETERLNARLTRAEATAQRERARREEAELALEHERTAARERSAELARARAELDLARAVERESRATADLLDVSRRDHHAMQTRYEALADEHDRALRVTERLRSELSAREDDLAAAPRPEPPAHHEHSLSSPPHTDRPLNPALRSQSWALRLLALLILAAVVFAVYLILQSTVLR